MRIANAAYNFAFACDVICDTEGPLSFIHNRSFNFQNRLRNFGSVTFLWSGFRPHFSHIISESRCILGQHSNVSFWNDNWLGFVIADHLNIPTHVRKTLNF